MPERTEFSPFNWTKKLRFSSGVRLGDTVYVSGQVAFDPDGNLVGGDDMGAQSRKVFDNVRTILEQAGASMDDVVKITAFITDMSRYGEYSAARAEAFPNNIPASSTVATPALVNPDLLIEVEAIAVIHG